MKCPHYLNSVEHRLARPLWRVLRTSWLRCMSAKCQKRTFALQFPGRLAALPIEFTKLVFLPRQPKNFELRQRSKRLL